MAATVEKCARLEHLSIQISISSRPKESIFWEPLQSIIQTVEKRQKSLQLDFSVLLNAGVMYRAELEPLRAVWIQFFQLYGHLVTSISIRYAERLTGSDLELFVSFCAGNAKLTTFIIDFCQDYPTYSLAPVLRALSSLEVFPLSQDCTGIVPNQSQS